MGHIGSPQIFIPTSIGCAAYRRPVVLRAGLPNRHQLMHELPQGFHYATLTASTQTNCNGLPVGCYQAYSVRSELNHPGLITPSTCRKRHFPKESTMGATSTNSLHLAAMYLIPAL